MLDGDGSSSPYFRLVNFFFFFFRFILAIRGKNVVQGRDVSCMRVYL